MALRDTWHRALVYFGLAEDHDYGPEYEDDYEPETGTEDVFERRAASASRPRSAACRPRAAPAATRSTTSSPTTSRSPPAGRAPCARSTTVAGADVQVHLVIPRNFNDAQQVADQFKRRCR